MRLKGGVRSSFQITPAANYVDPRLFDALGWHWAAALRIPENIEFGFLPPYCPDLNPQEQVWDELREKAFGNRIFPTLEAVAEVAVTGLQALEKAPERLRSLAHRQWVLDAI